jgi:hypothetical protein
MVSRFGDWENRRHKGRDHENEENERKNQLDS